MAQDVDRTQRLMLGSCKPASALWQTPAPSKTDLGPAYAVTCRSDVPLPAKLSPPSTSQGGCSFVGRRPQSGHMQVTSRPAGCLKPVVQGAAVWSSGASGASSSSGFRSSLWGSGSTAGHARQVFAEDHAAFLDDQARLATAYADAEWPLAGLQGLESPTSLKETNPKLSMGVSSQATTASAVSAPLSVSSVSSLQSSLRPSTGILSDPTTASSLRVITGSTSTAIGYSGGYRYGDVVRHQGPVLR
eukprot:TRINITY_DN82382_c0_g1_i1.p1 TRINITY_DN82382_c0_g1~~TRINITY_DN82382_c0_g1_i1.p1  ORF type:complete len:246 (-),score=22.50 TRINITY_DN82382_c0_g1_i1:650-1387(-)